MHHAMFRNLYRDKALIKFSPLLITQRLLAVLQTLIRHLLMHLQKIYCIRITSRNLQRRVSCLLIRCYLCGQGFQFGYPLLMRFL